MQNTSEVINRFRERFYFKGTDGKLYIIDGIGGKKIMESQDIERFLLIERFILEEQARQKKEIIQEVLNQAITVEVWDREEKDYIQKDIV